MTSKPETEMVETSAFGVLDPDGSLLAATSFDEGGMWTLLAYLFGLEPDDVEGTLRAKGYRTVPVTIRAALSPTKQEEEGR